MTCMQPGIRRAIAFVIFACFASVGWAADVSPPVATVSPPVATVSPPVATVSPPVATSRSELVNRWDLNSDGRIDEAEAEVARAKMRRDRIELRAKSDKPKPAETPPPTPPQRSPLEAPGDPLGEAFLGRPKKLEPKAGDASTESEAEGQSEKRELNAGRPRPEPGAPANGPTGRGQTSPPRSAGQSIVTGGARAGAPALRPGYGVAGPKVDLNAGRLPAGLPPARGMQPQAGSAPFRSVLPGRTGREAVRQPPAAPRRPPLVPSSPTRISAEDIGLP